MRGSFAAVAVFLQASRLGIDRQPFLKLYIRFSRPISSMPSLDTVKVLVSYASIHIGQQIFDLVLQKLWQPRLARWTAPCC